MPSSKNPSTTPTPPLADLAGNSQVAKHLRKLVHNIPQTLLFEGPQGMGKGRYARAFAKTILKSAKNTPLDFLEFFPEERTHMHSIHTIRALIKESDMPPFESKYRVFLLHDADQMLSTSMNALLKTLEEPLSTTIIILITSRFQDLPSTITSRCFTLSFTQEEGAHSPYASVAQSLAELSFNLGIHLLNREYFIPQEYEKLQNEEELLLYLFLFYRDLHLLKIGGDSSYLFYKDKEQILREYLSSPVLPLEEVQKRIEQIYQATILHIPLSHSLYILL